MANSVCDMRDMLVFIFVLTIVFCIVALVWIGIKTLLGRDEMKYKFRHQVCPLEARCND